MTSRFVRILVALSLFAVAGLALTTPRAAARQPDVLPALLTEVRGLRAAMEQMASAGPRIQLAMGRLQLQEQRVTSLLRRLDATRAELRGAENALKDAAQQQAGLERALREPNAPERQTQLEWELASVRSGLPRMNADYQRLVTDEATIAQEVASEQTRWSEINQRLDELDRTLARPR
jgi:chromosome segregation ATPase